MKTWTHSDLVERGARWLKTFRKCSVVVTETPVGWRSEIPDVLGWKINGRSVLIECKTSRGDFLADQQKPFRQSGGGVGAERWYMTAADLLKPADIPPDWGLAEVKGNGVKVVVPARPRKDLRQGSAVGDELALLVSLLHRVEIRVQPAQLRNWLKYECRALSIEEMQAMAQEEEDLDYA